MNAVQTGAQVICLTTAPNRIQAHFCEYALRAQGIRSQVVGDFLGLDSQDTAGIRPEIWVKRQDVIRAKLLLRRWSAGVDVIQNEADKTWKP